jgi:hypothetical protein
MGLFDIFKRSTPAQTAQKLKKKVTEKSHSTQSADGRQKAIATLIETRSPDVVPVLMQRFTILVDPQTTDAEEKRMVFDALIEPAEELHALKARLETLAAKHRQTAEAPQRREGAAQKELDALVAEQRATEVELGKAQVRVDATAAKVVDFLKKSESASSWAVKILAEILPEEKVLSIVTEELRRLGVEYTRDPEKKEVLLHFLDGKKDPQIGDVALALLKDMSDDVKISALRTLASVKEPRAREPVLELLVHDETAKRVQTRCVEFLHETGLEVQGFREKVEKRLADPYFLDKSGLVKKRGG